MSSNSKRKLFDWILIIKIIHYCAANFNWKILKIFKLNFNPGADVLRIYAQFESLILEFFSKISIWAISYGWKFLYKRLSKIPLEFSQQCAAVINQFSFRIEAPHFPIGWKPICLTIRDTKGNSWGTTSSPSDIYDENWPLTKDVMKTKNL